MKPNGVKWFNCEHYSQVTGPQVHHTEVIAAGQINGRRHEIRVARSAEMSPRLDRIVSTQVRGITLRPYGERDPILSIHRDEIPDFVAALQAVYEATR